MAENDGFLMADCKKSIASLIEATALIWTDDLQTLAHPLKTINEMQIGINCEASFDEVRSYY